MSVMMTTGVREQVSACAFKDYSPAERNRLSPLCFLSGAAWAAMPRTRINAAAIIAGLFESAGGNHKVCLSVFWFSCFRSLVFSFLSFSFLVGTAPPWTNG